MTSRVKIRCAFSGCGTTNPAKFHRFPKDAERCRQWVLATGNEKLKHVEPQKLNCCYRICSKHFSDWCFMNLGRKDRLVHNAVPCQPHRPGETLCSMKNLGTADVSLCRIVNAETSLKWWHYNEDNGEHSEATSSLDSDEDLKSYEEKLRRTKFVDTNQHSGDMASLVSSSPKKTSSDNFPTVVRCIMLLNQCGPEKDHGNNGESADGSSKNKAPKSESKEGESLSSVVDSELASTDLLSENKSRSSCIPNVEGKSIQSLADSELPSNLSSGNNSYSCTSNVECKSLQSVVDSELPNNKLSSENNSCSYIPDAECKSLSSMVNSKLTSDKLSENDSQSCIPKVKKSHHCCALCRAKREENNKRRFHRFPSCPEMSDRWAQIIGKKLILQASPSRRQKRYRVCSDHFSRDQYASCKFMRLHVDAVPNSIIDIGALRAALKARISGHSVPVENTKSDTNSVPKPLETEESSKCNTPNQKASTADPYERTVSPQIPKIRTFFFGSE